MMLLISVIFSLFIAVVVSRVIFGVPASYKGYWITYWLKWVFYAAYVYLWQAKLPKRLSNYYATASYEDISLVPSATESAIEKPQALLTDRHEDNVILWGGDSEGRIVFAKIARLTKRRAYVVFIVRDHLKNIYTLPNHPDSIDISVDDEGNWRGNNLLLECVEPMRTWRLKFNGQLRKGIREEFITYPEDDDDQTNSTSIIHAKFDFIWKAMRNPVDLWKDSSTSRFAQFLACETNPSSSNFTALQKDGYDQLGALHGTVSLGGHLKEEWYLRGSRQRRWGLSDTSSKSINIFTFFNNGNAIWIEVFGHQSSNSHCVAGHVVDVAAHYWPISWNSLELNKVFEENSKNLFLECKAGGKKYHLWNHLEKEVPVYFGEPWTMKQEIMTSYVASHEFGEGWGIVIKSQRYNGVCPVPERIRYNLPSIPKLKPLSIERLTVVPLNDHFAMNVSLTGGKGASLACLLHIAQQTKDINKNGGATSYGHCCSNGPQCTDNSFVVPVGFVVTTGAWHQQIKETSELKNAITSLEQAVASTVQSQMKDSASKIKKVIEKMRVREETISEMKKLLKNLFSTGSLHTKRFAVRSSGCSEDSKSLSSAGQNETILNCRWKDGEAFETSDLVSALLRCWASQFSFESIEYKRQRGQPINDGMAVVIQEMVPADSAGVLFTRDSVTGNPEFLTICANYGLGESVVSASAEPDTIQIQRTWRNKLSIHSRITGTKKTKFVMEDTEGGTKEEKVLPQNQQEICLDDAICLRLSEIAVLIEKYYGFAVDLEFAVVKNDIYLLQARPLTFLENWTDYELIHEGDSAVNSDEDIYTVANVGEVMKGYTTPLSISVVLKVVDISLQDIFRKRSWPFYYKMEPQIQRILTTSRNNVLFNFCEVFLLKSNGKIDIGLKCFELALFGHEVITEEMIRMGTRRFGVMSNLEGTLSLLMLFKNLVFNKRNIGKCSSYLNEIQLSNERVITADDVYKSICSKIPLLKKILDCHMIASNASSLSQFILLMSLCGGNENEFTKEVQQSMAMLFSSMRGTESGEIPTSLKTIAKYIAENEDVEEFLQMTSEEGKVWLESDPGEAGKCFREFLQRHGHRCDKEFDFRTLSWDMSPGDLVPVLQMMVLNKSYKETPHKNSDKEELLNNIKTPMSDFKRKWVKALLGLCELSTSRREQTKSMCIKSIAVLRKSYRRLGEIMVSECRIPDFDLIFFLTHGEVGQLLKGHSAPLVLKAVRRRKIVPKIQNLKYSEIASGVPTPINFKPTSRPKCQDGERVFYGTGVCEGCIEGVVRVVPSIENATNIQAGDILVTYSTDVGWSPYFPLLSGIITEIGGLISHGAVVAREYGLPSVIGVRDACTLFESGEKIMIDGARGVIEKLSL